ncbi:MAG: hypothetical protein HGB32_10960 [Geobacteraceae bacterium]|nr:hypothetical protein [Geobacteraceae bacterium]NTW80653.1 hypothetical protein [Geobacteraceae bacterium]
MKHFLSHIILLAMLVISPVSFSTVDTPNFDIPDTINCPLQESKKVGITVAHRVVQTVPFTAVLRPSDKPVISLPTLPAFDINRELEHGRAPPVIRSV